MLSCRSVFAVHFFKFHIAKFDGFFERVANRIESLILFGRTVDSKFQTIARKTDPAMSGFVVPADGAILTILGVVYEAKIVLLAV